MRSLKGSLLVVLLLFIALTAIGASGYLYLQNRNLRSQLTNSSNPTETQSNPIYSPSKPSPSQSQSPADETARWKNYTNDEYRLSLQYPSDWEIGLLPMVKSQTDIYQAVWNLRPSQYNLPISPLEIVLSNRSYDEEVKLEINEISEAKPVQLTNRTGVRSKYQYGPTGWYGYKMIFPYKSTAMIFRVNKDYEGIVNRILSTFRFTD